MAANLPSCFLTQFLEQLLKFLLNSTLSQRSYDFLITTELIFWLPNFGFFSLCSLLYLVESYPPEDTIPEHRMHHYLLQPGEEHDDQCKRATARIWSKKTY